MTFVLGEARPVFAHLPSRSRLIEHVGQHAGAVLLGAPSGWGKTVLTSQIVDRAADVLWADCGGESLDDAVLGQVVHAIRERSPGPTPGVRPPLGRSLPCLVFDDVAIEDERRLAELVTLRSAIAELGWRLIVTTRSVGIARLAGQQGFQVLTHRELALDADEADAIAQLTRGSTAAAAVKPVLDACGGHAALFSLLVRCGDGATLTSHIESALQLVDALVSGQLDSDDVSALVRMAVLGHGEVGPQGVLPQGSMVRIRSVEAAVPLVSVVFERSSAGMHARFSAHELLFDWALSRMSTGTVRVPDEEVDILITRLLEECRLNRALRLALDLGLDGQFASLLEEYGQAGLEAGLSEVMNAMLERLSLAESVARPGLMLLWSRVLLDLGRADDALGKARAARMLAEHAGDTPMAAAAGRICASALMSTNRWTEARDELNRIIGSGVMCDDAAGEAHLRTGLVLCHLLEGRAADAIDELRLVHRLVGPDPRPDHVVMAEAAARCVVYGDFASAAELVGPLVNSDAVAPSERAIRKGNLSSMLTEIGRLERAYALQEAVERDASTAQLGYFLRTRGMILAGLGEPDAASALDEALRHAIEHTGDLAAAQTRICQSTVLRAQGMVDRALVAAERAYEALSVTDSLNLRRVAGLEVAASLLSLGDVRAARAWAETVAAEGFGANLHHALRGAMVLSECDRLDGGDPHAALRGLEPHIISGNSNWQLALYCRAFPALLGSVAGVVGVDDLPTHMLRMILPEHAETCLRAIRSSLDEADWTRLGDRILGAQQMATFVSRGAEPICHVRLFGGLDVSIDGRTVREKDWRKRKSRLLFAMLVARGGQDVPRDQILEHLWPQLPPGRAKNNFYVVWSMMKGALMGESKTSGPCPYIESARGRCRIVRSAVRSDVDDFEDALNTARTAEEEGDLPRAVKAYEQISTLYQGELLPGDLYDDWFAPLRDHYRFEFMDAMVKATELLLELDQPCEAVVFARRGIAIDKSREDLYQLALRAHIAAGQRSSAIDTFMQCKYQLSEELGLDPSAETMRLYAEILSMEERPNRDSDGLDASISGMGETW